MLPVNQPLEDAVVALARLGKRHALRTKESQRLGWRCREMVYDRRAGPRSRLVEGFYKRESAKLDRWVEGFIR